MQFMRRALLPLTVFVTGGCVLVIEVAATRILAPYFGNTIYSISSVISVVLAALSVGYYVGGRLADRWPNRKLFFAIIAVSGIMVLMIQLLQARWLPSLGYKLPLTSGPLIMSLLLFFVPSFILGLLSPFAVVLQQRSGKTQGLGTTAGEVFFFSTVGSIAGSLLTGFVLIPHVGVKNIILGVGALLVMWGLIPLLIWRADRRLVALVLVLAPIMVLLAATAVQDRALYTRDGVYEKISIFDGIYKGQQTRFLRQDHNNSGAAFINSNELAFTYTKYYALHELFMPKVERTLTLGGGAYSIPKAILASVPNAQVDVAEIEPSLYNLSKKYFGLYDNPHLHNYVADGRRMLHDTPYRYDLIYSDVYNSTYSIPAHFTTKEFFELVQERLEPQGIFVANLIGSVEHRTPSFIWTEVRTMQQVFPQVYVFAVESAHANWDQNVIVVGSNDKTRLNMEDANMFASPHEIIRSLPDHYIDTTHESLEAYQILTDDFSPVDYLMTHRLIR